VSGCVCGQVPERERRIADFKQLFGDPTFKEHKLTVPAGRYAVVLAQRIGSIDHTVGKITPGLIVDHGSDLNRVF
jgi:hypothetical protein